MTPAPSCAYTVAGGDGMEIWQDGVLAGLAAVGLAAILWLLAGLLFACNFAKAALAAKGKA